MGRGWNVADVWEAVADRFPEAPALLRAGRTTTWSAFERRAEGVGAALADAGLTDQSKVAQLLYNGPEYLESFFAAVKQAAVPVNVNYRYTGDELRSLLDDADAEAVVFHSSLTATCDAVRRQLPAIRLWLQVDDGGEPCPQWAVPYEQAAGSAGDRRRDPSRRSGDNLILLYTGGTTGQPKGVMWPQDTLFRMLEELNGRPVASSADPQAYAAAIDQPGPRVLPAAPLMHGTAMWFAIPALNRGGCVVTMAHHGFDPAALLDTVVADQVKGLCIVGDAFARPIVRALEDHPGRWDLSGLRVVFSSGASFSPSTKAALLAHAGRAVIVDSLGSSESGGLARTHTTAADIPSVDITAGATTAGETTAGETTAGATTAGKPDSGSGTDSAARPTPPGTGGSFRVGGNTRVIDEHNQDVEPGSGRRGRLAISGHIPVGYYGDPIKTAETFVTIDGVVHVVAGDWAEVEADGTIRLLGRGSTCINTGGEKVFPDEVEVAIKRLPAVRDAVVVGIPDSRFGEAVAAVVEPEPGATVDLATVADEVRRTLAPYKAPRHLVLVPSIGRAANGKADYRHLQALAAAAAS